jgi:hypothetical protein
VDVLKGRRAVDPRFPTPQTIEIGAAQDQDPRVRPRLRGGIARPAFGDLGDPARGGSAQ